MHTGSKLLGFGLAAGLALLAACSGDGGYRSPTAPPLPSQPLLQPEGPPGNTVYVGRCGDDPTEWRWEVLVEPTIWLRLVASGGQWREYRGTLTGREFSAELRSCYYQCPPGDNAFGTLAGAFSQDFSSFEATETFEEGFEPCRWHARRVEGSAEGDCPQPPALPQTSEEATPGTYARLTPQCKDYRDRLAERLVFESDGTFRIETESTGNGHFVDRGTYSRAGSLYSLQFERWYTAGALTAEAAFKGRCVVVDYNGLLELNGDYADGEYCR